MAFLLKIGVDKELVFSAAWIDKVSKLLPK
jgi:hypothetical protein